MYVKCQKCELNYIKDTDELCGVCNKAEKVSNKNLTPNSSLSDEEVKLLAQRATNSLAVLPVGRYKANSYQDVLQKYPYFIIMIKAGCFYDVRECSALIINDLFKYTLCRENYRDLSRIKTGFPLENLSQVTNELKERRISYIVINNYKVFDLYDSNDNCFLSFINVK